MRNENIIIDKQGTNLLITAMMEDYVYTVAIGESLCSVYAFMDS